MGDVTGGRGAAAARGTAILAPGREQLSRAGLDDRIDAIAEHLASRGVGRSDRVAVLLPNGPEMAVAFLGVIAVAGCAPLNPAAPAPELERLLGDLAAAALVVDPGVHAEGAGVAARLGIPVVEVSPTGGPAGAFDLGWSGPIRPAAPLDGPPQPGDVALLLHTSGTTSRPKLVPLTHANLRASAVNVSATLQLQPGDRCLNLMPLFHIHGLVAALMASLHVDAGVICTPGFSATEIVDWVRELEPTWYTAVPTIHQAMLDVVARQRASGEPPPWRFRFVRSSSAALPVRVMSDLEAAFGAPVVEAYGMTEATHQMASNPLPPAVRKPGTVGPAAGPEIAILGPGNRFLEKGAEGEIVIRGPNVTAGYVDNPAANDEAFVDGWFRTGDLGRLDADGYLTISGRLKEIINRGGENIAPREVDDALLEHPDVAQAVAFAVPHARLGEEVAAAVVLRPGSDLSTGALRRFVTERLADAKVPRRMLVVDEIPKGPSGKLQRTGLAATLGLDHDAGTRADPFVAPRDDVEQRLAHLVREVLRLDEPVGATDDFFDLGADSLHTVELFEAIREEFGRPLNAHVLLDGATVERMAAAISNPAADAFASVVAIQPEGSQPPLFTVTRAGAVVSARQLVRELGPDQPLFGLWVPAMHGPADAAGSIEEIARECVRVVREVQPFGPYHLLGHSMGGLVAYDMARQLAGTGERVGLLLLADVVHPSVASRVPAPGTAPRFASARRLFTRSGARSALARLRHRAWSRRVDYVPGTDQVIDHRAAYARERAYMPAPAVAPVVLFTTRHFVDAYGSEVLGWDQLLTDDWTVIGVPGSHDSMIGEPHVHVLGARIAEQLRRAAG